MNSLVIDLTPSSSVKTNSIVASVLIFTIEIVTTVWTPMQSYRAATYRDLTQPVFVVILAPDGSYAEEHSVWIHRLIASALEFYHFNDKDDVLKNSAFTNDKHLVKKYTVCDL